ncbi:MAG: LamG domain-containing protein [Kiritimatiellae bacterium]|nr:LamG domain-containing protein [Kiritimatiellia bacterium]
MRLNRKFALAILAGALAASAGAADMPFVRTESRAAEPGTRIRTLPRTWIFAEWEPYGPHQNMMHRYTERPLYMDIRDRAPGAWTYANFVRDTRICHDVCGLDGFASLDYFGFHLSQLKDFEKVPPPAGYSQMIVIPGYTDVAAEKAWGRLKNMIVEAAKSKYTTRFDGRLVMWTYGGGYENQRRIAKKLRADAEMPPFIFVAEMPFMDIHNAYGKYEGDTKNPRPIPAEVTEPYRAKLAEFVKDVDGLNVWCTNLRWDYDGEYPTHSEKTDIYRKYLLPIVQEVMARPENRGKLVGSWLRQGYVNPFSGTTDGEYGTETLRNYLDSAILINPDLLMCFEWNEANENTHFQPTVAHGRTFARVLNFYRALLDRTPPKPMPGDDLSVPNLVVSVRQAIKLGEPWHCELLYLPDGARTKSFSAQLTLKGSEGQVIKVFPRETFRTDELLAIDYRVSSERLSAHEALAIELETDYQGVRRVWQGFDSTRIRTTACRDYLYSNMPIREQLLPKKTPDFRVMSAQEAGKQAVSASFEAGEPLATLEVIDDLEEVLAAPDAADAWNRDRYAIIRGGLTTLLDAKFGTGAGRVRKGWAWFEGSSNAVLRSAHNPWTSFQVQGRQKDGRYRISSNFGGNSLFFALVPHEEVAGAKLVLDFEGYGRCVAPLETAWRLGKFAQSQPMTVRLDLWRENQLPDYPSPLGTTSAALSATVQSVHRFPAYQLRAVSMSGKIWRGPLIHPKPHKPEKTTIAVWSDLARRPVEAEVFTDALPDLTYAFDSGCGAWLRNSWEALYDAQLGGGGRYGEPMNRADALKRLPLDFARPDPAWTNLDGRAVLRFEKGAFLQFPHETMLRGTPYAMAFEIRPDDASDQVLIRTLGVGNKEAQMSLVIRDGTLHLTPYGVCHYRYPDFDSGFRIRPGVWNRIVVARDYTRFRLTVNGECRDFPYGRRARLYQGFVFGSNVQAGANIPDGIRPFTGYLRAFRVRHGFAEIKDE